jgi:hypothetical protein
MILRLTKWPFDESKAFFATWEGVSCIRVGREYIGKCGPEVPSTATQTRLDTKVVEISRSRIFGSLKTC